MRYAWRFALLSSALFAGSVRAGEIPGMPSQLPPTIDSDVEISFVNDFIGRGGSVDDFRTQQLILMAKLNDRWLALVDHSILTRDSASLTGRVDQFSGSLGYRLIDDVDDQRINALMIGAGFRSAGDFAGERIQNGFHQLVGSEIDVIPYTDTSRTDITAWIDAEHYTELRSATGDGWVGKWSTGYWLRGSALATSDGQFDASAAAFVVANRNAIDIWFGLRQDWRSGYTDDVLRETADAEEDLSIVLGVRFGALVLETVQQTNNDASYGQLRLVSSGYRSIPPPQQQTRMGIDVGFILPDVQVELSGRFRTKLLGGVDSRWQSALLVDYRYGEPQKDDDPSLFVRSHQLTVGLDWERLLSGQSGWMSYYVNAAVGWRSEQLFGEGALAGETTSAADRAVLSLGTGLRFSAATLGAAWKYRIQTGLTAWLPFDDAQRLIGGEMVQIQEPAVGIHIGMTFDYD